MINISDLNELCRIIRTSELNEPTKVNSLDKKILVKKLCVYFKSVYPLFNETKFIEGCEEIEVNSL